MAVQITNRGKGTFPRKVRLEAVYQGAEVDRLPYAKLIPA
jgi:hypothetical protein